MVPFQKVLLSHKNSGHFVVLNSHHVKSNNIKLTIHHVHVGQAQLWVELIFSKPHDTNPISSSITPS